MPDQIPPKEWRAHFDFSIEFANGGGMEGHGFRLDLPAQDLDEDAIGRLLVRHLGLALVGSIRLSDLTILEEAHRGSRDALPAAAASTRRVVDLSHVIREGLITYPGLPAPVITPHLTRSASRERYAPGTEFEMDIITMIGNTGTYLDAPFHRYGDGADLAGLELSTLVDLPAEVFHLTDVGRAIGPEVFYDRELRGSAVLLHTGWDRHFGAPAYGSGAPFLTAEGTRHLVDSGVVLVGIDSLNIDDTESGGERPAHTQLLAAGIHVVEHLTNLGALPPQGARFTAAPPAVTGFGTFPVRAYATLPVE